MNPKNILVTGSSGFIGKNLIATLRTRENIKIALFDVDDDDATLRQRLADADVIFHLAGVNRPQRDEDFEQGNADLTARIVGHLLKRRDKPLLVLSSSIQSELDNPYGRSKRKAEEAVEQYGKAGGNGVIVRFANVFGKWSRPNYNSAVATFCHNIARGLDITISHPKRIVELIYIDDVVSALVRLLEEPVSTGTRRLAVGPITKITLGDLVKELHGFRDIRTSLMLPDLNDRFRQALYATYLSFLSVDAFAYQLAKKEDQRGSLAELLKSPHSGQMFVSRTKPGFVRGNHYHHTKVEKFCVLEGKAIIRFRHILGDEVLSYNVAGDEFSVLDIPPGYTHSIENTGSTDLIVLFWASEILDPKAPDTFALPVTDKQ